MDPQGRYSLSEMRLKVRRRSDLYRAVVNVTTGVEGAVQQLDPLVTNEDIDMYLNSALTMRMIDLTTLDGTIMADSAAIDIVANQVEYELPEDLQYLRAVYLKDPSVTYTEIPPNFRTYLYEYDQEGDLNNDIWLSQQPTYRRRLNTIVLNQVPKQDNVGGLVVEYVKLMLALVTDDQIIESPLARVLQEVIILDATISIVTEKMKLDASELRETLKGYVERLQLAAANYHQPKVIRMVNPTVLANPPMGRRPRWVGFGYW